MIPPVPRDLYLLTKEGENPRRDTAVQRIHAAFGAYPIIIHGLDKNRPDFEALAHPGTGWVTHACGARAAATGHRLIWKLIVQSGRPGLVFEDDILFPTPGTAATATAAALTELAHTHWDWIQFNHPDPHHPADDALVLETGHPTLCRRASRLPWCTVCYAVSPAGAARLLAASETLSEAIDYYTRHPSADTRAYLGPPCATFDPELSSLIGYPL